MAAHLKLNQRRAYLCADEFRKRAWNVTAVGVRSADSKKVHVCQRFSLRMRMKKQFVLVCVTLTAVAPVCFPQASPAKPAKSASNQTATTDLEKSAWESYKNKQADAFRKLMSKDYYATYAEGIKSLDREVADMANTDLRDYSLTDMKVVFPRADVAVTTYKSTVQQTSESKDLSDTYNSGSVWVKKDGKWLEVLHTEAKAK